jgi:DNA-binding GntR family transcriptional regulator
VGQLGGDVRIRAVMGRISGGFPELVESHRPIVDALEKRLGREAGLLLRNRVETVLEFLRKSESDSEFQRVLRKVDERITLFSPSES